MDFAERLVRAEREYLRINSNQFYALEQGKIYRFQSPIMQSSFSYGSYSLTFSYRFVPIDKNVPMMYPVLHIYNQQGQEPPLEKVDNTIVAGTALSNYEVENGVLILNNPSYMLTTFQSFPDIGDPSLRPFSAMLEIVSTSDGVLSVEKKQ